LHYRWPGNVRELRNWVEATVAMGESVELSGVSSQRTPLGSETALLDQPYQQARAKVLQDFEAEYLKRLLDSTGGNVSHAAKKARMDRSYLIKLLQKHALR
jgi:DNA-binding NtrC family response regulator